MGRLLGLLLGGGIGWLGGSDGGGAIGWLGGRDGGGAICWFGGRDGGGAIGLPQVGRRFFCIVGSNNLKLIQ